MALSSTEQLDFLWKKVGYGVTKTDTAANKLAFNEGIPSPLLLRADKLWAQAAEIPATKPAVTSAVVKIYKDGTGTWSPTVKCVEDLGASDNRTWKTNSTDWIPPEFGATYLVSVYIDSDSATAPQSTGTQLFAAGASATSNDEWFFDYQSGVLHFIGTSLPTAIATGVTGKSIFVSGARYTGVFGLSTTNSLAANTVVVSESANIGNLRIVDTTISSTGTNSNISIVPSGVGIVVVASAMSVAGRVTATHYYGDGGFLSNISANSLVGFNSTVINNNNSNVQVYANTINVSAQGTANVVVIDNSGMTVNGSVTAQSIYATNYYDQTGNTIAALNVDVLEKSGNIANSMSSVSRLRFDKGSGIDVVNLGGGVAKISVNSGFNLDGGTPSSVYGGTVPYDAGGVI
jgi:hypothetical protein